MADEQVTQKRKRRVVGTFIASAAAIGLAAGGAFLGSRAASPTEAGEAAAIKTIACNASASSIQSQIQAGDIIDLADNCVYHFSDSVRVTVPNVTIRGGPGTIIDGGRPANWITKGTVGTANALYPQGASDGLVVEDIEFRNFRKSVIYARLSDNATYRHLRFLDSGSDGSPADPAAGPQDHALYLDGGIGIRVEDVFIRRMTGAGLHPYSGSGSFTTGVVNGMDVAEVGRAGIHFGAASTGWVVNGLLSHHNVGDGVESYNGSGNRIESGYIWANGESAVDKRVPIYVGPLVFFTPPPVVPPPTTTEPPPTTTEPPPTTTEPPPTTTEPPPETCDAACVAAYEAQIDALEAQVAAEKAVSAALRAILAQIHALAAP